MRPAGLLLAGGAGSRMGASAPKPLIEIGGATIARRVLARLAPHCDPVLVSANDREAFGTLGYTVLPDRLTSRLGPLAGLDAAFVYLRANASGVTHLVCLPGDTPFLPADIVPRLVAGAGSLVRVAAFEGRLHPTVTLWPLAALVGLGAELKRADGVRSLHAVLDRIGFEAVPFEPSAAAPGGDPFFNVNTPGDLSTARKHLESR